MFELGVERISKFPGVFKGKRLGLLTSASGVDQKLRAASSILHALYPLCALYGPEHGIRAAADAGECVEGVSRDKETGLPVYSLYCKDSKRFTEEMLSSVDAVVYDIQDLGLRFYTYVSMLLYAMEDCARFGKELIVLDRPALLGGLRIEGGFPEPSCESILASYPMPIRYGLTAGEFAHMANVEKKIGCHLTVIPMADWERQKLFPELRYPFIMPSPSIPRFDNALLYAGTCLFEGTNLSEGRGTSDPFALIGAPYIDAFTLTRAVQSLKMEGVLVTPAFFTPTASKYAGTPCQGIHLHLTNATEYPATEAGLVILNIVRELYPKAFNFVAPSEEGELPMIDLLSGSNAIRLGFPQSELLAQWRADSERFRRQSEPYLLY